MKPTIDRVKAAIFDLDGTLVRGPAALPGAVSTLGRLRERGIRIAFCTQDSVHAPAEIAARLHKLGFCAGPDDVIATGWVAAEHLARRFGNEPIYLVAGRELRANFAAHGCNVIGDDDAANARAVFIGRDPGLQPEHVAAACRAVWSGARFFGSGRDRVLPSAGRDLPGAGGIIAAVEYATQRRATILGKPSREMAAAVLRRAGTAPAETLVIGDQVDADIRLGKAAGCRTVLVLTGGTTAERAQRIPARWQPDAVLADVGALPDWLGGGPLNTITPIAALRAVAGIVFDLDGTLIQAERSLPGAREAIEWMREHSMPFVLCTQDTELGAEAIARRLRSMDLAIEARDIITCGTVILDHLTVFYPDAPVCVVADPGQTAHLRDRGVNLTSDAEAARVILVERYGGFSAEEFDRGCRAVWAGAAFLGMARDRAFRTGEGLIPGNGATVRAIEHATRRRARILGKPSKAIAALALRALGLPAGQVLVVGDDLDADVGLGKVAGCRTALTLAGVTSMDDVRRAPARLRPDVVVSDVTGLLAALRS